MANAWVKKLRELEIFECEVLFKVFLELCKDATQNLLRFCYVIRIGFCCSLENPAYPYLFLDGVTSFPQTTSQVRLHNESPLVH